MIVIDIPDVEFFDSDSERFLVVPGGTYSFEHSLKAIAKWESFWKLPYLNTSSNFTREQTLSYYCCMCEDPTIDYRLITYDVEKVLIDRINDRATATTIQNDSHIKDIELKKKQSNINTLEEDKRTLKDDKQSLANEVSELKKSLKIIRYVLFGLFAFIFIFGICIFPMNKIFGGIMTFLGFILNITNVIDLLKKWIIKD